MTTYKKIKSCFPYFGGKAKIAPIIWKGFGQLDNYVEPFAGSLAVLLANPHIPKIETINDIDSFLCNFWRAVSIDPEGVAKHADYPVNETDLHARHRWLVSEATDEFRFKMNTDPDYYDVKIAGWWVWGMGASIPGNWVNTRGLNSMPLLSSAGGGIHGLRHPILEWFKKLQERTRRVRVCCGDWSKVISSAVTYKNKGLSGQHVTGVFLDPPYSLNGRVKKIYHQDNDIFQDVCKWAVDNGNNPHMRIAMCGYENDYIFPSDWSKFFWKTNGGMANQAIGNSIGKNNSKKEIVWFSPYSLVKL